MVRKVIVGWVTMPALTLMIRMIYACMFVSNAHSNSITHPSDGMDAWGDGV